MKTTKFYKVCLLDGHKANEDQIKDGCLKDAFCDTVAEYSRGEAIKKARMFGGKIEIAQEVRYMFINIEIRDGEREYNCKSVFSLDAEINLNEYAEDYPKSFHGEGKTDDDEWYWDSCGETMCRLHNYKEVTKVEYDVLRNII